MGRFKSVLKLILLIDFHHRNFITLPAARYYLANFELNFLN